MINLRSTNLVNDKMKIINCYLKNIKICNIVYPNDPIKPQNLPVPLKPVEEPLR